MFNIFKLPILGMLWAILAFGSKPVLASEFLAVCDRTSQVMQQIVTIVPEKSNCIDVTEADLAGVSGQLDLDDTNITSLKAGDFSGLTSLQQLSLDDNQLSSLPLGIFDNLTSLTTLNLGSNQLSSLPVGIFDNTTSIEFLQLDNNQLTSLPDGIFDNTTSIEFLYLDNNQLTSLPDGIFANTASIEFLYLDNNQLTSLPAGIFANTTSLSTLFLNSNQLTSLPAGIFANTTSLSTLFLYSNELTTLPSGFFDGLTSLESFSIFDNANNIPIELTSNLSAYYLPKSGEINFTLNVVQGAPQNINYLLSSDQGYFQVDGETITAIDFLVGTGGSDNITFTLNAGEVSANVSITTEETLAGLVFNNAKFELLAAPLPAFAKNATVNYLIEQGSYLALSLPNATLDGVLNYTISALENSVFSGLTYDSQSNSLVGTALGIGNGSINLTVINSDDYTTNLTLFFDVQKASVPSFYSTVEQTIFHINDAINLTLPINNTSGNGELLVDVKGLPNGLIYNQNSQKISGLASEIGTHKITITLSDSDNVLDSNDTSVLDIDLTIEEEIVIIDEIILEAPDNLIVEPNQIISLKLPKPADTDKYTYSYKLRGKNYSPILPGNLDFDSTQATLNGSISLEGTYPFVYIVSKIDSPSVSFDFNITVQSSQFATLSRDILTRQALIISKHITSTVKTRSKQIGKAQAPYERQGNKEAINIILKAAGSKNDTNGASRGIALSFWTDKQSTAAQSSLHSDAANLSWNGNTESKQSGFDITLANTVVGIISSDTSIDLALPSSGSYRLNLLINSPFVAYHHNDLELWATIGSASDKSKATYHDLSYQSNLNYAMQHIGGRYQFQKGSSKFVLGYELTQASFSIVGGDAFGATYGATYLASSNRASSRIFSIDTSHSINLGKFGKLTPSIRLGLRTDILDASDTTDNLELTQSGQELGWSLAYDYDWLKASFGSRTFSIETSGISYEEISSWYNLAVTKRNKLGFGYTFGSSQGEEQDYRSQLFGAPDLDNLGLQTSEIGTMDFNQQLSYGWQLNQAVVSLFSKYSWSDDSFSLGNFEPRQSAWQGFGSSLNSNNGNYSFSMLFDPNAKKTLFEGKIAIR